MTDKLSELRQTINQLDDEILVLIRRRMVLAADVIAAKNGGAAYRPGREAQVMARLVASAPDLSAGLVVNLWRQLMPASTALQSHSMTIAVHRDAMAVAGWHFGGFFRTIGCDDLASVRQAMADGADIALLPAGCEAGMAGWLPGGLAGCDLLCTMTFNWIWRFSCLLASAKQVAHFAWVSK